MKSIRKIWRRTKTKALLRPGGGHLRARSDPVHRPISTAAVLFAWSARDRAGHTISKCERRHQVLQLPLLVRTAAVLLYILHHLSKLQLFP